MLPAVLQRAPGAGELRPPPATTPQELVLLRALPIKGPARFQPSGLLLRDGELWTVSDKHGAAVFRLDLGPEEANAVEVLPDVVDPVLPPRRWFDAEGLAEGADGLLYLASEGHVRIFVWREQRQTWSIASDELSSAGKAVGLFAESNAGIEGLVALGPDAMLVAAEREPRGLIEIHGLRDPHRVMAQRLDASIYPIPARRGPDFADLATWRGRVLAVARNQHLVVELERGPDGWREGAAWSYATAENDPRLRYRDRAYGLAEGLAIDDATIYLAFDNNDDHREANPRDARPLLFVFKNSLPR